jgi:hypothetical protein
MKEWTSACRKAWPYRDHPRDRVNHHRCAHEEDRKFLADIGKKNK